MDVRCLKRENASATGTFTPATQVMQATHVKTVRMRVYFCLFWGGGGGGLASAFVSLLFKPKQIAKMRLLAIRIDPAEVKL